MGWWDSPSDGCWEVHRRGTASVVSLHPHKSLFKGTVSKQHQIKAQSVHRQKTREKFKTCAMLLMLLSICCGNFFTGVGGGGEACDLRLFAPEPNLFTAHK